MSSVTTLDRSRRIPTRYQNNMICVLFRILAVGTDSLRHPRSVTHWDVQSRSARSDFTRGLTSLSTPSPLFTTNTSHSTPPIHCPPDADARHSENVAPSFRPVSKQSAVTPISSAPYWSAQTPCTAALWTLHSAQQSRGSTKIGTSLG